MFKKLWEKIKAALQSPPGKFIAAFCGGIAVGSLAYKAASSKDRKRIAGGGGSSIDTDDTRDTINSIQQQQREAIDDRISKIDGLLADIRKQRVQDN